LPAGGHRSYSSNAPLDDVSEARYWSCSWTTDHATGSGLTYWGDVFIMEIDKDAIDTTNHGRLITGNSIRCVSEY
jgi:hypothetical protein